MTKPPDARHPLDLDDDELGAPPDPWTRAYQPLLKICVAILIASSLTVFLSAVAGHNLSPYSFGGRVANVVNRLATVVLLFGFVGTLIAYRLPAIQAWFQRPTATASARGSWLRNLLVIHVIALGLVWSIPWLLPSPLRTLVLFIEFPLLVLFNGWLVTVAIWHDGSPRAYAVGFVTAMFMQMNLGFGTLVIATTGGGIGMDYSGIALGIMLTMAAATGILCALYVRLLEQTRLHSDSDAGLPPPPQQPVPGTQGAGAVGPAAAMGPAADPPPIPPN